MKENVKLLLAVAHIQAAKDCFDELKTSSLMTREMKVTTNNFNKAYKRSFEKVISSQFNIDDEILEELIANLDDQVNKVVLTNINKLYSRL